MSGSRVQGSGDNHVKDIRVEGTPNILGSSSTATLREDEWQSGSGLSASSTYQVDDQCMQNSQDKRPGGLGNNDLRIQLRTAKKIRLGQEESNDLTPLNSISINRLYDSPSSDHNLYENSLIPNWKTTAQRSRHLITLQSSSESSEIEEKSSLRHGQFESSSRADTRLTLGRQQLFSIREISPEWAFSNEITEVIVTGDFLCDASTSCWAVMFGDIEVPAEVVKPGALRCHTPLHSSGKQTLCVTSGNREACSEVKGFEFRAKLTASEELILAKFAQMLLGERESSDGPGGDSRVGHCPKHKMNEEHWEQLIDELNVGCENPLTTTTIEELLESKLQQWLSAKLQADETTCPLSKHDQSIIHFISSLGFERVLSSVLSAGVSPNSRDSYGWTPLHWAAYFGREKVVAKLLGAGASATAVTNPTANGDVGKTAAFLASERGHIGLVRYLSEVSLASHLAPITLGESDISKKSSAIEVERAVCISRRNTQLHYGLEYNILSNNSLATMRNVGEAGVRIQNAFHASSFRKRSQTPSQLGDECEMTEEDMHKRATASRSYYQHSSIGDFYKAAVLIQKIFRGKKGWKSYLNIRRNIVKIQALVRSHQTRKKYKSIISADSDVEKIIPRWRQYRRGLRGFQFEQQAILKTEEENDDPDVGEAAKIFRQRKIGKVVNQDMSKLLSMVDSPEARLQYGPMLKYSCHAAVEEPPSSLFNDVMAWSAMAMGKQRQKGGFNHTCVSQADRKLIGKDDIIKEVTEKILLVSNGRSNCTIIRIDGGSGHGKTSMLQVLYNDQDLIDAFDKRIWIQMSDKLDLLMLFRKIAGFCMSDHCIITNPGCLQEKVKEEIKDKKFLLFLDGVAIKDRTFWNSVSKVLYNGARGSAVVMASSNATVAALRFVETNSYFLKPLSEENNLMLLQQYAVVGTDIQENPDLLMVSKRFISRFGANPLNLKAISGLLCHIDTSSLEKSMFEGNVMALQLCHDVLPIHLKRCLAFCSLFPEGYIFDKHHMVLLWISHGCVSPIEGCEIEDVGAEYFSELLCRSFFQYSPLDNKDDKFVLHELIYKVIESVSRNKYFKSDDLMSSVPQNILHLSLVSSQFQTVRLMPGTKKLKDLRTFLAVQPEEEQYMISVPALNLIDLDDFFLKFTSLETLDLSHTNIEELPESIVGLRNLHYLSVNNTSISALPSGFCSLSNLQTFKAKDCRFLTELPGDTKNLLKLRHLDLTKELGYVHLPHGIGQLTELRTLAVFHASGCLSHCCITELGNLHSLRGCLWLSGLECVKTCSKAQEILKDKQHLQNVTLEWHDDGADIDDNDDDEAENVAEQVLEGLEPHANLQELAIRGYEGTAFPAWMQGPSSLPNLVSLTLDGCCNCTQLPAIAQLPLMKFLGVRKMYDVQRLCSDVDGVVKFPSLEVLNLWEMYGLEELFQASEGDCPFLRKICVSRCPDLKRLPSIPSLVELVLHYCHQLPNIPHLGSLASLKIEGFHGVKSFSLTPAVLPKLKKLEIRSCSELYCVHGLEELTTVQRLKIRGCPCLLAAVRNAPGSGRSDACGWTLLG